MKMYCIEKGCAGIGFDGGTSFFAKCMWLWYNADGAIQAVGGRFLPLSWSTSFAYPGSSGLGVRGVFTFDLYSNQFLLSGLLFGLVRKGALPMTINDLIALLFVTLFILVVLKA